MRTWLREARLNAGYTMKSLSEAIGVTTQSIGYYETGERRPTPDVAIKIGEALGFDWTRFYDEKPINKSEEAV